MPFSQSAILGLIMVIALLGPIVMLTLAWWRPSTFGKVLQDYQTLATGFLSLVAGGLALLGVLITVREQRLDAENQLQQQRDAIDKQIQAQNANLDRQLKEQRDANARAQTLRRQQIAGGFVGEINTIVEVFQAPNWQANIKSIPELLERDPSTLDSVLSTLRVPSELNTFFKANVAAIGQLPNPVPQHLLEFYGTVSRILQVINAGPGTKDDVAESFALGNRFVEVQGEADDVLARARPLLNELERYARGE